MSIFATSCGGWAGVIIRLACMSTVVLINSACIHFHRDCDREFWNQPAEEMHEIVAAFPLEKQFVYHQQRHHCIYPNESVGFVQEIASHGETTIGFFWKTLEENTDGETVFDVAEILLFMYRQDRTYDAELVKLLRSRISALKNGYYKESAEFFMEKLDRAVQDAQEG